MPQRLCSAILLVSLFYSTSVSADEPFGLSVKFKRAAVNSITISSGDGKLAVYGLEQQNGNGQGKHEQLLLTHHRRDVLGSASGVLPNGSNTSAILARLLYYP